MFAAPSRLLSLGLASLLVWLQVAMPLLHVGCGHDHSSQVTSTASTCSHGCHSHHRTPEKHSHDGFRAADSCAACRHLALSAVASPLLAALAVESVQPAVAHAPPTLDRQEPVGLYRSRAPPTLS
jgi:hypothetical protein